ncbi:MAG: MFS transporter [Eubacteriales bacterium]|nr:MFS transporter [Eubacteriales bacterium]
MIHLLLLIIYLSFVSLGLPDAMLGAAWPIMSQELNVPVSYAGMVAMVISLGTIVSSFLSDRMTRTFGTGRVTAVSVGLTAAALLGFSASTAYWQLILWAIPYGLGAGSVDASLNNYVALHYASRHMSWLHCMWGVGASAGPSIIGMALTGGMGWSTGYRIIGVFQILLTAVLFFSLPLWKKSAGAGEGEKGTEKALSLREILAIPGAKEIMLAFFCYCAAEQTAILWGSSYLVLVVGMEKEIAASLGSLFLIGITLGRFASGFITYRLNDRNLIRLGQAIMVAGMIVMVLPLGPWAAMAGLLLVGLGSAPIYPSIIHSTPGIFGAERSQAIIGVLMASAYIGCLTMPTVFGFLANHITPALLPLYLGIINATMILMCEKLNRLKAR